MLSSSSVPFPDGRTSLRNTYLLLGVGAAVLVAATVVGVGAMGRHDAQVPGAPTVTQSLPSGHPSVAATQSSSVSPSPAATGQGGLKQLQAAAKADPHDVTAQLKLGDAYFLAQRFALAEKAYQSALHTRPGDPTATVRLAMVWHASGQTQRAVRAIEGVLAQQPAGPGGPLLPGHHLLLHGARAGRPRRVGQGRGHRPQVRDRAPVPGLRGPHRWQAHVVVRRLSGY